MSSQAAFEWIWWIVTSLVDLLTAIASRLGRVGWVVLFICASVIGGILVVPFAFLNRSSPPDGGSGSVRRFLGADWTVYLKNLAICHLILS